jgi:glycogen debranching enzyme
VPSVGGVRGRVRAERLMDGDTVRILDGSTFVLSDGSGDIDPESPEPVGLFALDTRYLSTWVLTLDGERLHPLSIDDQFYFQNRFFLVASPPSVYIDAKLMVIRNRSVSGGFQERLTVLNHQDRPVSVNLRIDVAGDFADIPEVWKGLAKQGHGYTRVEDGRLVVGYQREGYHRQAVITVDRPARFDERGLELTAELPAEGSWNADIRVGCQVCGWGGAIVHLGHQWGDSERRTPEEMRGSLEEWTAQAPRLRCDWEPLARTYRRSLADLAALRFTPMLSPGQSLPAAGLPWYLCLTGRDSIMASLQALPFTAQLAYTTLRILAARQGARCDVFREEEPGRILHELRYGEVSAFEEMPYSPYFGSADATMLFVVLLDEYERWTGDGELIVRLEDEARAALAWIDGYADRMGNGYVSYQPSDPDKGTANQGWKNSWDAISYRDGRLPGFPRATCELQGYAYDAKQRAARLAREVWDDPDYAGRLEREAAELRERFNRDFWVADGEYYALALDGDGSRVDALSSNIGHLLWSGIVDADKCPAVVRHLMGPQLFSGWGVRTLALGETRYNPLGAHTGSVWPSDNAIVAAGLRRYGYKAEAAQIGGAILDVAEFFGGSLPAAFAGYDRHFTRYPVRYPGSSSPQALSAVTPLMLLRTMLGLHPYPEFLAVDPALPVGIGRIELLDIPTRWGLIDAFGRDRSKD